MEWQTTPYVMVLFVASVVTFIWGLYGLRLLRNGSRNPTVGSFIALAFSVTIWAGMYGVQVASPTLESKLFAYKLLHVGAVMVPPAWLAFALAYTDREELLTPTTIAGIVAIPLALLLSLPTNPYSLALTDAALSTGGSIPVLVTGNGPLYLLHLAYSYVVTVIGAWLIVTYAIYSDSLIRRQAALVVTGALVPLGVNIIYLFSVPPFGSLISINPTPVLLAFSAVLFGLGVFRYRMLDLTPIAAGIVLEQMKDGVIVLDANERIIDLNPAAAALFGPESALIGDDISTHLPAYGQLNDDGSVLTTLEGTDPDRFIQLNRSKLSKYGTGYGWVLLIQDVTAIEESRRKLEQQNERLDAFTRAISHDLRNQLSLISGHTQLAKETGNAQHFDIVRRTVSDVTTFLEDLLDLARQGKTVTDPKPVSLTAVIEDVRRSVSGGSFTVEIEAEMVLPADRARLQQAIDNLFRNARDNGEGDVSVTVGRLPDGFFIEDNGPGIPEDKRERIFEVGYTTNADGSGFGLPIVHDIIEAHGWTITATDGENGGARFEIIGIEFEDERS